MKAVLYNIMDAMSVCMDCRDKLNVIHRITGLALTDLDKQMAFLRDSNSHIESQLKNNREALCKRNVISH